MVELVLMVEFELELDYVGGWDVPDVDAPTEHRITFTARHVSLHASGETGSIHDMVRSRTYNVSQLY